MPCFEWITTLGGWRFGMTHDLVFESGEPYLERWILWFGFTLRLHKFHKGDDDRAFHDHPWWFVTLPLTTYLERTPEHSAVRVSRLRPHFRRASHRHIVQLLHDQPVWTFIITGPKSKEWGFWDNNQFIHHEQWLRQERQV
jgi:hypothetical protein